MGCCNNLSSGLVAGTPNASMHVNFVKGMVLGVDDYRQEFAYLSNGYQWAVRDLIGYGTASGLAVHIEDDGQKGPRIEVTPGSAVPPSARMICVGAPQCGWINDWLAKPDVAQELTRRLSAGSPPDLGEIDVYLTLCFRDCAVLPVPIPGEPCRSDDELMTPSRIADDYVLSLSFDAPEQTEADAIARLVSFIDEVEVEPAASPPATSEEEEAAWRGALDALFPPADDLGSPPASPPVPMPSPPGPLVVAEHHYDEFLRFIFRLWITEFRPAVMARRCGTDADDRDDCLLLARLAIPVLRQGNADDRGWQVDGGAADIIVDESRRPMIVPLHLVQTVLGMAVGSGETGSPLAGPQGDPGAPGVPGDAATIAIGTVNTLPPGTPASVTNVGTASAAILDFGIPEGQPGAGGGGGAGATVTIGSVTALPPGTPPTVTNSGTASDAIFDFGIPGGNPGAAGADGAAGTDGAPGAPGAAATIAVGNVTSVAAGTPPSVTNSGSANAAVLDFQIPEGQPGPQGPQGPPGAAASPLRLRPISITANFQIPDPNDPDPKKQFDAIVAEAPNLTVVLPPAKDAGLGRAYIIRCLQEVTNIRVKGAPDTIENNPAIRIRQGTAVMLMSDGKSRWIAMLDLVLNSLMG